MLENGGLGRGIASLITTSVIFSFSLLFIGLVTFQAQNFISDWPDIKETMRPKVEDFKTFIFDHTPLTQNDLDNTVKNDGIPFIGSIQQIGAVALGFFSQTLGFLGTYLLVFIYIFFLLTYRKKFKTFIVLLFSKEKKKSVEGIVAKSGIVVQQYLVG